MSRPAGLLRRDGSQTAASGSFHAGAPIPTTDTQRAQLSHRYQTFPTPPPKTPIEPRSFSDNESVSEGTDSEQDNLNESPLPVRQLLLLAFLSLAEQTALNSISPYLPNMVASMPGIPPDESGLYVGILASAFALAQLSTNFLWGYWSDMIGRKPVLLLGTLALICCFSVFGLCRTYWQIVVVHVAMGMLNGNAACVPTVLGEVTDRSNQSRAFTYLPIIYSLGSITGPALGGLMVGTMGRTYPYLGSNVVSAALLTVSFVVIFIWFEETLEEMPSQSFPGLSSLRRLSSWISSKRPGVPRPTPSRANSWASRWPRSQPSSRRPLLLSPSPDVSDDEGDESIEPDYVKPSSEDRAPWKDLLNRTTLGLLATYLVFQLTNISFNSLYPIFAASPPPTGRGLDPGKIGVSLSLAGLVTILFQAFVFQRLKFKLGNMGSYRLALLGIAATMVLIPWVGYLDSRPLFGVGTPRFWLYLELELILGAKNIFAVGGLSSVMLLITNSAPSHASLGTLNGVAQTLSALGRSFGPFLSGALFTLSTNVRPKGEALAWSLFGGLALFGWVGSLFISRAGLESDDWVRGHHEGHSSDA